MSEVREMVRENYAAIAKSKNLALNPTGDTCCGSGCGCGPSCGSATEGESAFGSALYQGTEQGLPDEAISLSLGCGNPTAVASLEPGERVLDLGSGGGIDVLLSARRVGEDGFVFGLDMTDEMLEVANENKRKSGLSNVEFLKGYIEAIPLPANTVDVVISNCVINLSADKPSVLREMHRVLVPGGRIAISDIVSSDELTPELRAERGSHVGCIAGALSFSEYRSGLEDAGFTDIALEPTHAVADGMFSATIRATKPEPA